MLIGMAQAILRTFPAVLRHLAILAMLIGPQAEALRLRSRVEPPAAAAPEKATPLPNLFTRAYSREETLACLTSVCGTAAANLGGDHALMSRNIESATFKKRFNDEFAARIEQTLKLDQESSIAINEHVLKLINKGIRISKTPDNHAFRALLATNKKAQKDMELSDFIEIDWSSPTLAAKVNAEKLEDTKKRLSTEEFAFFESYIQKYVIEMADYYAAYAKTGNPVNFRLQRNYPLLSPSEALKRDAASLLDIQAKMKITFPLLSQLLFQDHEQIVTKASTGAELSKMESEAYFVAAITAHILSPVIEPSWRERLLKIPVDWTKIVSRTQIKGKFEKELAKERARDVKKEITDITAICRTKLAQADASRISDFQKRRALQHIESVRAASKTVLLKLFGKEALSAYGSAIDDATFSISDPEDHFTAVKKEIESEFRSSMLGLQITRKPTPETDQQLLAALILFDDEDDDKEDEKHDILEECEKIQTRTLTDHALTSQGRIGVSWYTAAYPQFGIGVLAHEMGHVLSKRLREGGKTGRVEETYMCVKNRNPYVLEPAQQTWLEEDFADFFAAQVVKELRAQGGNSSIGANFACALIDDNGDTYGTNDLEPGKDDPHSSPFLRMILQSVDLGDLTPQCRPFVEYAKPASRALVCH